MFSFDSNRYRLTSASDEDFDADEMAFIDEYEEHMQYMAARERLQEFPGRIPPRKKRDSISNSNEQPRKSRVSTHSICILVQFEQVTNRSIKRHFCCCLFCIQVPQVLI